MCWNFFKCENIAWIRISKKDLENEWISCRVMTLCGRLWYCSQFYSMHSMKSNHKWAKKVAKQYFLEKLMFVVTVTQHYSSQLSRSLDLVSNCATTWYKTIYIFSWGQIGPSVAITFFVNFIKVLGTISLFSSVSRQFFEILNCQHMSRFTYIAICCFYFRHSRGSKFLYFICFISNWEFSRGNTWVRVGNCKCNI